MTAIPLTHIVPRGNDTMLNGVLEGEDTTLGVGFITNERVLLAHADHHTLNEVRKCNIQTDRNV